MLSPLPRWTGTGGSVTALFRCGLPRILGGSASTTALSGPSQGSLTLRPARLLQPLRLASVPRASAGGSLQPTVWVATGMNRQFPWRDLHPLASCALVAHQYIVVAHWQKKSLSMNILLRKLKFSGNYNLGTMWKQISGQKSMYLSCAICNSDKNWPGNTIYCAVAFCFHWASCYDIWCVSQWFWLSDIFRILQDMTSKYNKSWQQLISSVTRKLNRSLNDKIQTNLFEKFKTLKQNPSWGKLGRCTLS